MRAVKGAAARLFADQQLYTVQLRACVAIGIDEKVMNRAPAGSQGTTLAGACGYSCRQLVEDRRE